MIAKFKKKISEGAGNVSRHSALSLGLTLSTRVLAALGGLLFGTVIAKIGGSAGLGAATLVISLLLILSIILRFGTDQSLIRLTAQYRSLGRSRASLPLFLKSLVTSLGLSAVSMMLLLPLARPLFGADNAKVAATLILSLPALTAINLVSAYLKGMKMSAIAALSETGAISGLAALATLALNTDGLLSAMKLLVVVSYALAIGATGVALWAAWRNPDLPAERLEPDFAPEPFGSFLLGGLPFMIIGLSVLTTQSGAFAVGGIALDEMDLGLLRACERLVVVVSFALTAINPFIAPRLASAWARQGSEGVKKTYGKGLLASVALATPPALLIALFGRYLLSLFGPEFTVAYPLLLVMMVGPFVHACLGSLNMVLTMTGHEREAMWISIRVLAGGAFALWAGSVLLGPFGFASAYSLTMIWRDVDMLRVARKRVFAKAWSGTYR